MTYDIYTKKNKSTPPLDASKPPPPPPPPLAPALLKLFPAQFDQEGVGGGGGQRGGGGKPRVHICHYFPHERQYSGAGGAREPLAARRK